MTPTPTPTPTPPPAPSKTSPSSPNVPLPAEVAERGAFGEDSAASVVRLFLRKPVTVLMVLVAVCVVGAVAYSRIPVQQWPGGFELPVMVVILNFANPDSAVSPIEVEEALTKPAEEMLSSVPGLTSIDSRTSPQRAFLILRFESGTPMSVTYAEVKDRIDRVRAQLTDELSPPTIWTMDPDDEPIIEYGLAWAPDLDAATAFSRIDDEVIPALEGLAGVAQVTISGALETYFQIELRADDLSRLGINPWQLTDRLRQDNFAISAGHITDGDRKFFVVADARIDGLDRLRELPVNATTKLADVAEVMELTSFRNNEVVYLNGRPAVRLEIKKSAEGNTVEVCRNVDAMLTEMIASGNLDGFYLTKLNDTGEKIGGSVNNLLETAITGGMWAFLILFVFLRRARLTLLIMLNTPLSLLIALVVMYFLGESINMLTLMGFTLVVGMLVDNAVVVTESIARFRETGEAPENASARGTGDVMLAVTLATATSVVVFLPLMLMAGSEMLTFFLTKIGIPLIISLSASLFVAIVFIPLAAKALAGQHRLDLRQIGLRRVMSVTALLAFGALIFIPLVAWMAPEFAHATGLSTITNGTPDGIANANGNGNGNGNGHRVDFASLIVAAVAAAGAILALGFLAWAAAPLAPPADRAVGTALERFRGAYLWLLERALRHRMVTMAIVVGAVFVTLVLGFTDKADPDRGEAVENLRQTLGLTALSFSERPRSKPNSVRVSVTFPPTGTLGEADAVIRDYNRAIDAMIAATAPMAQWPADLDQTYVARRFGTRLMHDAETGTLHWNGFKDAFERDAIIALSADPAWKTRIATMYRESRQHKPEIPFHAYQTQITRGNGRVVLYMNPDDPSWEAREVGEKLVAMLPSYPGVVPRFGWGRGGGGGGGGGDSSGGGGFGEQRISLLLQGPDTATLVELAGEIERRLERIDGLADVTTDIERGRDELQIHIDRELAMQRGANPSAITRTVSFALNGTNLGDIQLPDGRRQRLRMRFQPSLNYDAGRDRISVRPEDLQDLLNMAVPISPQAGAAGGSDITGNRFAEPGVDRPDDGRGADDFGFSSMVDAQGNRIRAANEAGGDARSADQRSADTRLLEQGGTGRAGRQSGVDSASIGGVVPLRTFVIDAPQMRMALNEVRRSNQQSSLQITAAVDRRVDLQEMGRRIQGELASLALPSGYQWNFGEQMRNIMRLSGEQMPFALLTALFCVFALMAVFFESVFKPFAILFTVPLAFIGAAWAWMWSGLAIDVVVIVGAVILIGLVVNNGIVLVDLINRHINSGMPRRQAILEAGKYRFRPILMTALTTIVGLIPMSQGVGTFNGVPYFPIARTVIGGLVSSTLLTLIVIPVTFSLIDDFARDVKALLRFPWRRAPHTDTAPLAAETPPSAATS